MSQMQCLSETDSLTGLPNRHWLTLELRRRLLKEACINRLAVVYSVNNFKRINDSLGHKAGDQLLQKVADRLKTLTGPDQALARMGGDEFVILVQGDDAAARARAVAWGCDRSVRARFRPAGQFLDDPHERRHCRAYRSRRHGVRPPHSCGSGDVCTAKADGKAAAFSRHAFIRPILSERAKRETERYQELQYALNHGELQVAHPARDASGHRRDRERGGVGAGALASSAARRHSDDGLPALCGATGLIVPIGDFVLEQLCRQMWSRQVGTGEA